MLNSQGTLKKRLQALAVLTLCVSLAALIGFFAPFEELSKKVSKQGLRSPSGTMIFVGLGPNAEPTFGPLPWRYSDYARLLESLENHSPKAVMFDLRMDYNQAPAERLAFEQALSRAKFPVILRAVETGNIWWQETEAQPPLPEFARHARIVGEQYKEMMFGARFAPTCVKYGSAVYPHAAVVLAGKEMLPCRRFAIDLGIDPSDVPYFKGTDLLEGKVRPGAIDRKTLVIGSTHYEETALLGGWGRTEDGTLAIIAAETLLKGAPLDLSWYVPLALAFLVCLVLLYRLPRIRWYVYVAVALAVYVLVPLSLLVVRIEAEVVPALTLVLLTFARVNNARAQLDAKREGEVTDPRSGLPNLESLREQPVFGSLLVAMSSVDPGADRALPAELKLVGASQEYDAGFGRRLWRVESIGTGELFSTLLSMKDAAEISGTSFGFSVDVDVASPPFKRAVAALERAQEAASEGVVVRSTADEPRRLLGPPGKNSGIYALPLVRPDDGTAAGVRLAAAGRANDSGAIVDLGQLRDVFREAITISGEAAPLPDDFRILVPVDMELVKRPQSIEAVREAIRSSELRFDQFAFEISLPAFHASGPRGLAALQGFRKLGLEIVVSDFSGPEPGLEALRAIPATAMLVHCLGECASLFERDALRTGMRLALELGRDVIASGVSKGGLPDEVDDQSILLLGTPTSVADLGLLLGPDRRRQA